MPFFFVEHLNEKLIVFDEITSKHMINVLRMKKGDEVCLTNGKGKKAGVIIVDDNRKRCTVETIAVIEEKEKSKKVAIGISLIKNASRFEWFLEKGTEIGVNEIIPLICERTEKEKFRYDRMKNIVVSAMLQSQQCWLPVLREPVEFAQAVQLSFGQKFIAHCDQQNRVDLASQLKNQFTNQLLLIGPEGDFSPPEIELARASDFIPVSLGNTRLRTETAGIVGAAILIIGSGS